MLRISTVSLDKLSDMGVCDLSRLTCNAAAELDNYRIDFADGTEATMLTAQWMKDRIDEYADGPGRLGISPIDAIFLHELMKDTKMLTRDVRYVKELLLEVEKVRIRLHAVATNPQWFKEQNLDELNHMRDFCLRFSILASVNESYSPHRGMIKLAA